MREIVLDTETTGLDPKDGHRIVEIGCVELMHHVPTGRTYQCYINPLRPMSPGALQVTGLTDDFLKDFPTFDAVVQDFLAFIGEDPLVIHNARFDMKFLNAELGLLGFPALTFDRVVDTLEMARRLFPGSPGSLDALCRRFGVDNSNRTKHGALLDSELLAEVYIELKGGRQPQLLQMTAAKGISETSKSIILEEKVEKGNIRPARNFAPSADEVERHQALLMSLKNPLWLQLVPAEPAGHDA
ncbi:MAG: DNA polymerase III subunit epsilon [Holosporales bacterium]